MRLSSGFIFLLFVFVSFVDKWDLRVNKEGIKVFVGKSNEYRVPSVRAETEIKASIAIIKNRILNVNDYPQWVYKCKSSKIIRQVSKRELYYYQVTDAPFPVKDRDLVSRLYVEEKDNWIRITMEAQPGILSGKSSLVRIKTFKSVYIVTPVTKGTAKVVNELTVDPGIDVPSWIMERIITEGPFSTMKELRRISEGNQDLK